MQMRICPAFLISQLKVTTSATFTSSPSSNNSKKVNDSEKSNDTKKINGSEKSNDSKKNQATARKNQGVPLARSIDPSTQVFKAHSTVLQLEDSTVY